MDTILGDYPENFITWKEVIKIKNREDILLKFFNNLNSSDSLGASVAKRYMKGTRQIGLKLVEQKVAKSEKDVNDVMLTGFFHSYGPINNFLSWEEI